MSITLGKIGDGVQLPTTYENNFVKSNAMIKQETNLQRKTICCDLKTEWSFQKVRTVINN